MCGGRSLCGNGSANGSKRKNREECQRTSKTFHTLGRRALLNINRNRHLMCRSIDEAPKQETRDNHEGTKRDHEEAMLGRFVHRKSLTSEIESNELARDTIREEGGFLICGEREFLNRVISIRLPEIRVRSRL